MGGWDTGTKKSFNIKYVVVSSKEKKGKKGNKIENNKLTKIYPGNSTPFSPSTPLPQAPSCPPPHPPLPSEYSTQCEGNIDKSTAGGEGGGGRSKVGT